MNLRNVIDFTDDSITTVKVKALTALQRSWMRARLKKLLETGLTIGGTI